MNDTIATILDLDAHVVDATMLENSDSMVRMVYTMQDHSQLLVENFGAGQVVVYSEA